jgi:hypothetical protein
MGQLLAEFDFPMTPQGGAIPAAVLQGKPVYVPGDRAMTVLEQRRQRCHTRALAHRVPHWCHCAAWRRAD